MGHDMFSALVHVMEYHKDDANVALNACWALVELAADDDGR